MNAMRTVRMFEQAGASAIQLEDQDFPKRCGHMAGKKLISQEIMVDKVFAPSAVLLNEKLKQLPQGKTIDIESCMSQLTLDIIGKAVFNYDFNSLTKDSPVIQAVYTALKETEQRATDLLPYANQPSLLTPPPSLPLPPLWLSLSLSLSVNSEKNE